MKAVWIKKISTLAMVLAVSTTFIGSEAKAEFGYESSGIDCKDTSLDYVSAAGSEGNIYIYVKAASPTSMTLQVIPHFDSTEAECTPNIKFNGGEVFSHMKLRVDPIDPLIDHAGTKYYEINKNNDGQIEITLEGLTPGNEYFFRAVMVGTNGTEQGQTFAPRTLDEKFLIKFTTPFRPVVFKALDGDCVEWTMSPEAKSYEGFRMHFLSFFDSRGNLISRTLNRGGVEIFCRGEGNGEFDTAMDTILADDEIITIMITTGPGNERTRPFYTHSILNADFSDGSVEKVDTTNLNTTACDSTEDDSTDLIDCIAAAASQFLKTGSSTSVDSNSNSDQSEDATDNTSGTADESSDNVATTASASPANASSGSGGCSLTGVSVASTSMPVLVAFMFSLLGFVRRRH